MRRLLVIASLLALGGCTDGALDATSPMAMVRQLASANTDDGCVAKALEWGDKDHDEALTGPEFVDLTLIAFDATLRFARERLADAEANTQKRPGPAAERILAHARDDVAKAEARRQRERPRRNEDPGEGAGEGTR